MRSQVVGPGARVAVLEIAGVAVLGVLAGCGAPSATEDAAAGAARRFAAAVADGDGAAACDLLAAETRRTLEEDSGRACTDAVTEVEVGSGPVGGVDVYGDRARVVLGGDTLFLTETASGWRVFAAACTPREGHPYDCELESG